MSLRPQTSALTLAVPAVSSAQYSYPPPGGFRCPAGTSAGVVCQSLGGQIFITGTARNDTIMGTPFRDVIRCGAGDDVVTSGAGNDIRCGPGNDTSTRARRRGATLGCDRFEYTHMRDICRQAAIGALCSLLLPLSAHAQTGKRPDPDSPAGVEYQLPLDQARKNATGGGGDNGGSGDRDGGGPARLFGAGIVAAAAGAGGSDEEGEDSGRSAPGTGAAAGGGGAGDRESGSGDAKRPNGSGPALTPSTLPSAGADDGSAGLQIAGIVLAVLLLGVLTGLLLRRSLRQSGS